MIKQQQTGKRKSAVAKLLINENKSNLGKFLVEIITNKPKKSVQQIELINYFKSKTLINLINKPLNVTRTIGNYDIIIRLKGGGIAGQAGAVSHGLAKFLAKVSKDYRLILKSAKLLTRDARTKERKKFGLKKARKAPQFSKR